MSNIHDEPKLIVDFVSVIKITPEQVNESIEENKGRLIIPGVILNRANEVNKNKRHYRRELLEREDGLFQELIREKRAFGELDHPESTVVNLKNVSHDIIKTYWEGNHLKGDIEILDSEDIPMGRLVKGLLRMGKSIGVSSRGAGTTKMMEIDGDEVSDVQDDYKLVTFDLVSNPSTLNAVLRENYELKPEELKSRDVNKLMNEILRWQI